MPRIDHGYMAIKGQFDQTLRSFGLRHLVFFAQQEKGWAADFAHRNFALVVTVASFEPDVENIFMGITGQDSAHERLATAK